MKSLLSNNNNNQSINNKRAQQIARFEQQEQRRQRKLRIMEANMTYMYWKRISDKIEDLLIKEYRNMILTGTGDNRVITALRQQSEIAWEHKIVAWDNYCIVECQEAKQ